MGGQRGEKFIKRSVLFKLQAAYPCLGIIRSNWSLKIWRSTDKCTPLKVNSYFRERGIWAQKSWGRWERFSSILCRPRALAGVRLDWAMVLFPSIVDSMLSWRWSLDCKNAHSSLQSTILIQQANRFVFTISTVFALDRDPSSLKWDASVLPSVPILRTCGWVQYGPIIEALYNDLFLSEDFIWVSMLKVIWVDLVHVDSESAGRLGTRGSPSSIEAIDLFVLFFFEKMVVCWHCDMNRISILRHTISPPLFLHNHRSQLMTRLLGLQADAVIRLKIQEPSDIFL